MHVYYIPAELPGQTTTIESQSKDQKRQSHSCDIPASETPNASVAKCTESTNSSPSNSFKPVQNKTKLDIATESDVRSASPPLDEASKKLQFGCGCGNCTLSVFIEQGCPAPIPSENAFPLLDLSAFDHEQLKNLTKRLEFESRKIFEQFHELVSATVMSLNKQCVQLAEFNDHVTYLRQVQPVIKSEVVPLFTMKPNIVETISDIFRILEDYFSFFDYHVIELIIYRFGTEEDEAGLQRYKDSFKQYAQRRIFKYPAIGHAKIFVILDSWYDDYTDKEIDWLHYELRDILHVSRDILHFHRVEDFAQPTFKVPTLEQLPREQEKTSEANNIDTSGRFVHVSN